MTSTVDKSLPLIDRYVNILMNASGISREQAETITYYILTLYLHANLVNPKAILAIIGPLATGKSSLLTQIQRMLQNPKTISPESAKTLRGELNNSPIVIIDEAHKIEEDLLVKRYEYQTSQITYNVNVVGSVWQIQQANIHGFTIVARRSPFRDPATTSRAIIIRTKYDSRKGKYALTDITDADRKELENMAKSVIMNLVASQRIENNYLPLRTIAKSFGDDNWLKYSDECIEKDTETLLASQGYEPNQAALIAIKRLMVSSNGAVIGDVQISDIKRALREQFDLRLNSGQIQQICADWGFDVKSHGNYPTVKEDYLLLEKLLKEQGL
jgi:hypothetical protein